MRLRRISALVLAAAVATVTLTGCPWDKEEPGSSSSSSSSSSTSRPDYDDSDEDGGRPDKPEEPEGPDEPEEPEEPEIPEDGYEIDEATGTYTIYNEAGLLAWAGADNGDCTLAMDIDMAGVDWDPILLMSKDRVFDGNGKTISNLDQPLINTNQGTVKNLKLLNVSITADGSTGGVASNNMEGTIQNCTVTGSIDGTAGDVIGGIAGVNSGTIIGCTVQADLTGGDNVGGVAGQSDEGRIEGCVVSGNLTSSDGSVGGIVGLMQGDTVLTSCCFTGTITGFVAGGVSGNPGPITACYWSGVIDAKNTYGTGIQVTDGWTAAEINAMNAAMEENLEYEFALVGGQPKLVQKGSAEQAVSKLMEILVR